MPPKKGSKRKAKDVDPNDASIAKKSKTDESTAQSQELMECLTQNPGGIGPLMDRFGASASKRLLHAIFKDSIKRDDATLFRALVDAVGLDYHPMWKNLAGQGKCYHIKVAFIEMGGSVELSSFDQKKLTVQNVILLMEKNVSMTYRDRTHWFGKALNEGDLGNLFLDACVKKFGETRGSEWVILAMDKNRADLLGRLMKVGCDVGFELFVLECAARTNRVANLEALAALRVDMSPLRNYFGDLIYYKSWQSVDWLVANGIRPSRRALSSVLCSPDAKTTRWALVNGGDPFLQDPENWQTVVKNEDWKKIDMLVKHGIDLNRDKGYLGCYAAVKADMELIGRFEAWGYTPIEEAVTLARAKGTKEALKMVRASLAEKKSSKTTEVPNLSLPTRSSGSERIIVFFQSPAFPYFLSLLDHTTLYRLRKSNTVLRSLIPLERAMTAEQMWNMLAMELRDSDFRKVFLFKNQSGELTSFDELYVSFTDFRLGTSNMPIYLALALLEEVDVLEIVLRRLNVKKPLNVFLLTLICLGGWFTAEKIHELLSPFSFHGEFPQVIVNVDFGEFLPAYNLSRSNALDLVSDSEFNSMRSDAYRILSLEPSKRLAEIELNALRAAAYMGKVDYVKHNSKKFQLKKYSAMLNEAALIATERGHEELVRLMAREPTKRTFISARAITGGHWKIILRLMEQGFELDL